MLEQKGRCKICAEKMVKVNIDHDHETGRVRGLLCMPCNMGLGLFKDNIRRLAAAIVYLEDNGKSYYSS